MKPDPIEVAQREAENYGLLVARKLAAIDPFRVLYFQNEYRSPGWRGASTEALLAAVDDGFMFLEEVSARAHMDRIFDKIAGTSVDAPEVELRSKLMLVAGIALGAVRKIDRAKAEKELTPLEKE